MQTLPSYILFFTALGLSLALTPLFGLLAKRLDIVDRPAHRKNHANAVPYLGGAAVFTALTAAALLSLALPPAANPGLEATSLFKILLVLGCSLGVAALGIWDDARDLRARYKFIGQVVFVGLFVLLGFRFEVLHLPGLPPVQLSYLSIPLTMFWMLAVINAFNMVDGSDGLGSAVTSASLFLLAAATTLTDNPAGHYLALAALGAMLGFLPYNCKPARIYLGDAGSSGMGMFLAASLVALGRTYGSTPLEPGTDNVSQPFHYQILIATLLVAYPALEITLSVARRALHGRPIARADQGHIHHRLAKVGWSPRAICAIATVSTLLAGSSALATLSLHHGRATWILAACGVFFGLGLSTLGFLDFLKPKVVQRFRPHFQIAHHFISMQRVKLGLADGRREVLTLVNQACQELGVDCYRLTIAPDLYGKGGLDYAHQWDPTLHPPDALTAPNRDRIRLPGERGAAEWVFEPHNPEEEELNVEYRVLISEFMREALETCLKVGSGKDTLELPSVVMLKHQSMSGHSLRKRRRVHDPRSN